MTPDQITVQRISTLHPAIQVDVINIYRQLLEKGISIRIVQALRTWQQQAELYKQGRTTPGNIVTWAKAGESFHNYGLAFDFCLLLDNKTVSWDQMDDNNLDGISDWMQVVEAFEKAGFTWGGRWDKKHLDLPHFQKTFGLTITQCLERSKGGKVFPIVL